MIFTSGSFPEPFPDPQTITLPARADSPSVTLSVHEAGTGPAVVFCHGFPDLAYGWHHQLRALDAAGFRVIAPNQRGYAGSSRPDSPSAYGLTQLTGDLASLLDVLGIERAYFVGHDWGGFVAWAMPVLHPDRVLGVAGLCYPPHAVPQCRNASSRRGRGCGAPVRRVVPTAR